MWGKCYVGGGGDESGVVRHSGLPTVLCQHPVTPVLPSCVREAGREVSLLVCRVSKTGVKGTLGGQFVVV